MQWYLVDREGSFRSVVSAQHADDMVVNAACALVGVSSGSCRLRLRPAKLEIKGFSVLSELLRKSDPDRIWLSWLGATWHDELLPGGDATIERLVELMLTRHPNERFQYRARALDDLAASHVFSPLIALWRANGVIDLRTNLEAVVNCTRGKYLTVYQDMDAGEVKFSEFGKTKWAVYDSQRWMTKCIGQPVRDQPDYEYGCWTAKAYRDACQRAVPTLCDMDTIILDPTGGGDRRLQYNRLTLPAIGHDGSRQMLATSCHDSSVFLRAPID
ncbi:MAG: hypothetical protein JXQ99_08385 [Hyphomicrobiaceae bacterium]